MYDRLYLWVRLYLEPTITEMAFTSERVYRRRVVVSYLLLLSVVADAHADMVVARPTESAQQLQCEPRQYHIATYHHMLNGSSKRVMRMPWSIFRALSPSACLPGHRVVGSASPSLRRNDWRTSVRV